MIVANKIATHGLLQIIIIKSKQAIHYIYFLIFRYAHIIVMIKKLELHLLLVLTEPLTTEEQIFLCASIS